MRMTRFILTLVLLYFCTLVPSAEAAVTFDNSPTPATASGAISSINQNITVGGGCTNPYIEATVIWKGGSGAITTTASATAGAMTDSGQGQKAANNNAGGEDRYVQRFYRAGPTGVQTVTATFAGGTADLAVLITAAYCGVNSGSPVGTAASATGTYFVTPTVDVTVSTNGLATDGMAMLYDHDTMTAAGGQTEIANEIDTSTYSAASYKTGCSGTCSMTWNYSSDSQPWAIIAIPVNPAAATGPPRHRVVSQ